MLRIIRKKTNAAPPLVTAPGGVKPRPPIWEDPELNGNHGKCQDCRYQECATGCGPTAIYLCNYGDGMVCFYDEEEEEEEDIFDDVLNDQIPF